VKRETASTVHSPRAAVCSPHNVSCTYQVCKW